MALTRVTPNIIAVANNVTNKTVGNTTSIPSFTFDGAGVVTAASNVAISGAGITANTVANSAFQTGSVENYLRGANLDFGMRNRIINGAMVIDQRNAGANTTLTTSAYTLDRWYSYTTQSSKFSIQQNAGSVTPPVGFTNYIGATSLSAYSITSGDYFSIMQRIEGYNVADLGWGSANAKTVTLSFQVYSSLTGTFGGSLRNSAGNRSYPFTYTISSANTWEYKTVTIAGDTSGTWLTTNGIGVDVLFSLGTGSTFLGTAGAWAGANYLGATGQVNMVATSGATFYITGVQLEEGSVPTPFEYRQYGAELALCQRYFQKSYGITVAVGTAILDGIRTTSGTQASGTTGYIEGDLTFRPQMRTAPSVTFYDQAGTAGKCTRLLTGTGRTDNQNIAIGSTSDAGTPMYSTGTVNASNIQVHYAANAEL